MVAFVTGIFLTHEAAKFAARELASEGFTHDEISEPPPVCPPWAAAANDEMAGEGALLGVAAGSIVGSIVGALLAVGMAGVLTGAGAGGAAGGYFGALLGARFSRESQMSFACARASVASGGRPAGILLGVRAELPRREKAQRVLLDCGAITIRQEILT